VDLAAELSVTRRQLSDAAVMDGHRLIEDGVVPAALVDRYREKGREWVLQRAWVPKQLAEKTPSGDPLVDESHTATAEQTAPVASVQPVVAGRGSLTRDEAVTTRERLRNRPPAGHGEAVRTTRTDTMFWATAEAQTAFDAVTKPDGDPIELALPAALLLFTAPTDACGRRGVGGAVLGMSWAYVEHTTTVLVYLWQDTDGDTLLPTSAFTIDLSDPWPTCTGAAGSTDEVAFLLGRWWTVAAEQHGMDHPHEPPAPSRGVVSAPRHPRGSSAGREQVRGPAVSFRTWRVRPPSTRRMDTTSPGGPAPVRRHVVRPHLHTYVTGPDRSERVQRLVLSYTRGGGSAAGRGDRGGLTVYVLRP